MQIQFLRYNGSDILASGHAPSLTYDCLSVDSHFYAPENINLPTACVYLHHPHYPVDTQLSLVAMFEPRFAAQEYARVYDSKQTKPEVRKMLEHSFSCTWPHFPHDHSLPNLELRYMYLSNATYPHSLFNLEIDVLKSANIIGKLFLANHPTSDIMARHQHLMTDSVTFMHTLHLHDDRFPECSCMPTPNIIGMGLAFRHIIHLDMTYTNAAEEQLKHICTLSKKFGYHPRLDPSACLLEEHFNKNDDTPITLSIYNYNSENTAGLPSGSDISEVWDSYAPYRFETYSSLNIKDCMATDHTHIKLTTDIYNTAAWLNLTTNNETMFNSTLSEIHHSHMATELIGISIGLLSVSLIASFIYGYRKSAAIRTCLTNIRKRFQHAYTYKSMYKSRNESNSIAVIEDDQNNVEV